MSVRKEKMVQLSAGKTLDARVEFYNSAEEVVCDCEHRPVRWSGYDMKDVDIRKSWQGVDSYTEALTLLKTGYQPTVERLRGELNASLRDGTRYSFSNNIQGFSPVVPLALKGVPNCMVDMQMKPIKAKVLDVYYDATAPAHRDPEEFIRAGKDVLGAIIELEKQGYRFNLYALQSYYDSDCGETVDMLCVKIKASNKPLDLKRISFPLTHPAFFRVIGFDWQGKSPITRYLGSGRGTALTRRCNSEEIRTLATTLFGNNACYISCDSIVKNKYDKESLKESFVSVSYTSKQ